ncbi:unnamed protein product [Paramecium pentaurelia]|uniref:Serine/threonine-protein phosphatase n=1 Tax=Paramecium pentaurelia TaxID=43138 RepID=A0A8S1TXC6_9CILI|nr:unnamed protein product [Paramecium pentaurelia]
MNNFEKVDAFGQLPLARFGHTITYIAKGKAILFGGATGDTGKYNITGDTFSFDMQTKQWKRIEVQGTAPNPRAAHAAVCVDINQIVIYGGATGGGSLASDDLYLLDLRSADDIGQWTVVPVVGTTPGRRYGHTLTFTKPFLIAFGGNTGQEPVNDCWCVNVEKSPITWVRLECKSEQPIARVYHSASICTNGSANGMVVAYGGRSNDQQALNDAWGLRRHRDGRWDWVRAPYKLDKEQPIGRYQHSTLFVYSMLIVIGGRTGNVGEMLTIDVYDTETSEWSKFNSIQRFRHSSWLVDTNIYVYGGFELDSPNIPTDIISKINLNKLLLPSEPLTNKLAQYQQAQRNVSPQSLSPQMSPASTDTSNSSLNNSLMQKKGTPNSQINTQKQQKPFLQNQVEKPSFKFINQAIVAEESRDSKVQNKKPRLPQSAQDNNIAHLFINTLLQPKTFINLQENAKFLFQAQHIIMLCDQAEAVIKEQPMVLRCKAPIKIFGDIHGQYSDLMRFFDLWGSPFVDGKDSDIEAFDYLFLGDYVDRGNHSLETICLLLALKVRYPESIHLIRGNHEDKWINNGFGFSEECAQRLGEDPNDDDSVFARVNRLFEWLPLAAIVEDKIICLHGGIGSQLNYVAEIENLQRPLEVIHEVTTPEQQLVVDILWSDPTDSDQDFGIQPNIIRDPAGTGNIVKFGPDRVINFLIKNSLSLIIRAHECVMDGFERFAGGQLLTVFSATDYCGRHKNAGAVLILKRNLEIVPKLIYPQNLNAHNWIEDEETLKKRPPTPPRWKNQGQRKSYE